MGFRHRVLSHLTAQHLVRRDEQAVERMGKGRGPLRMQPVVRAALSVDMKTRCCRSSGEGLQGGYQWLMLSRFS